MIGTKRTKVAHFSHFRYYLPIRLSLTTPQTYQQFPNGSLSETQKQFKKLVDTCLIVSQQQQQLITSLTPIMKRVLLKELEKYQKQVRRNKSVQEIQNQKQKHGEISDVSDNLYLGQSAQQQVQALEKMLSKNNKNNSLKDCIKLLINLRAYFSRQHKIVKQAIRVVHHGQLLKMIIRKLTSIVNNQLDSINNRFGKRGNDFDFDMQIIHENNQKIDVIKILLIQILNVVIYQEVEEVKKKTDIKQHIIRQRVEYYLKMALRIENITHSGVNSVQFINQLIKLIQKSKQFLSLIPQNNSQQKQKNDNDLSSLNSSPKKNRKGSIKNQLNMENIVTYSFKYQAKGQTYSQSFIQIFLQGLPQNNNILQISTILQYIFQHLQEIKAINDLLTFISACMGLKFYQSLQKIESRIRIKDYQVQNCKNIQVNQKYSFNTQNNRSVQQNNLVKRQSNVQPSKALNEKMGRSDQSQPFNIIKTSYKQFINLHKSVLKVISKLKDSLNRLKQGKINFNKYQPSNSNLIHQKKLFSAEKQRIRKSSAIQQQYKQKQQYEQQQQQQQQQQQIDKNDNERYLHNLNNDERQILKLLTQSLQDKIQSQSKQIQRLHQQLRQSLINIKNLEDNISQKDVLVHNLQKIVGEYISIGDRQTYLKKVNSKKFRLVSNILSHKIDFKVNKKVALLENNSNANKTNEQSAATQQSITTQKLIKPPPSLAQTLKNLNKKTDSQNLTNKLPVNLPANLPVPPPLNLPLNLPVPPPFSLILTPPPPLTLTLNDQNRASRKQIGKKHSKQVKTISWSVVEPAHIKDSFWQQVSDTQINQEEIFEHFGKKERKLSENRKSFQQALQKKKQAILQKKSLISSDRAKNIEIVLTKFRIQPRIIQNIVINFDQRYISQQKVQCLLNILPNQKQYEIFAPIQISQQQIGQWAAADYYLYTVTKLDNYKQRLQAILFKLEFQDKKNDFIQKCKYFSAYFSGLLRDPLLKLFMKYLLNVGNYLNSNSFRGTACGLKLDCIDRTYSFIGQETTVSLFEYVMDCVWRNEIIQGQQILVMQTYKEQQGKQQHKEDKLKKQIQQRKKKINLRQEIYKVYSSSIQYPVIGLKGIQEEMNTFQKQYKNIEQCIANIQLYSPSKQQITDFTTQEQFLKKRFQNCRDKVTEYMLPFYVKLQQDLLIMKDQLEEGKGVLDKFQKFYCDKSQSQKVMEIIKKFRGKVRQFMNKKAKQKKTKQFSQFQILQARGRFSLANSNN